MHKSHVVDKTQPSGRPGRWAEYELSIVSGTSRSERHGRGIHWPTVRVQIKSGADIVIARQQSRALALGMEFSSTDSAFIATTVSELARALLSRGGRGEIWLHKVHEVHRVGVVIVARNALANRARQKSDGAAIPDLELPDLCRLVDEFDVTSDSRRGTTIRATKWCRRRSRVVGG